MIRLQLKQHMLSAMIGVQQDKSSLSGLDEVMNVRNNCGIGGTPLHQCDECVELMRFNRAAVVWPYVDVDPYNASPTHGSAQSGIKDERPAMGNSGLDDHIGPDPIDY